ncbi:hypothetical protein [Streptomyces spongiicola]|uniref:hypothetical protein n=1 Tax=Streptomyces spongiicola TaxID=1690221 RepID=UPI003F4D3A00
MTRHEHGREDLPGEEPARSGPLWEGRGQNLTGPGPRWQGAEQGMSGDTPDGGHTTGLYGPDGPLDDRTGKETVNDGPRYGTDDQGPGGGTARGAVPSGPRTPLGDLPGRDRPLRDLLGGPAQDGPAPAGRDHGRPDGPDDLAGLVGEGRGRHGGERRTGPGAPGGHGAPETPGSAASAAAPDVSGTDGLDQDELALRRMLQAAVGDLEPTDGALDQLRRALPVRRARKRQALVGMAASVILLGTAVPAFVHVAGSDGLDDRPVNAGHGEQAQGGTGEEEVLGGGQASNGDPAGRRPSPPGAPHATQRSATPGAAATAGVPGGTGTESPDSAAASTPACEAGQLGVDATQAGAPDAEGKVYGTFRIANVSASECSVGAAGALTFRTAGAADAAKISVVPHTTGDAASGLPDPSREVGAVVLKPEAAYEVKFAFVPSETCPTTGASPEPSPTDGASGTSDGTGAASDTETQLDGGTTADGSVSVVHTPEPGAPHAEATIPDACAGTIYRTGLLNPS